MAARHPRPPPFSHPKTGTMIRRRMLSVYVPWHVPRKRSKLAEIAGLGLGRPPDGYSACAIRFPVIIASGSASSPPSSNETSIPADWSTKAAPWARIPFRQTIMTSRLRNVTTVLSASSKKPMSRSNGAWIVRQAGHRSCHCWPSAPSRSLPMRTSTMTGDWRSMLGSEAAVTICKSVACCARRLPETRQTARAVTAMIWAIISFYSAVQISVAG